MDLRVFNEYTDRVITSYQLTNKMVVDEWPKRTKRTFKDSTDQYLLEEYLKQFGIYMSGKTYIRNLDGSHSNVYVNWVQIDTKNIPEDNLEILYYLYGWEEALIDIGLQALDNCTYSIELNTSTKKPSLIQHAFGNKHVIKKFGCLKKLLKYYRENFL